MAVCAGGRWTSACDLRHCRSDVPEYHARRSCGTSALYRGDGVDESLRRFADVAGLPETLAPQRRIAGRCGREGFDRRGMVRWLAISIAAIERCLDAANGGTLPRYRRWHRDSESV